MSYDPRMLLQTLKQRTGVRPGYGRTASEGQGYRSFIEAPISRITSAVRLKYENPYDTVL